MRRRRKASARGNPRKGDDCKGQWAYQFSGGRAVSDTRCAATASLLFASVRAVSVMLAGAALVQPARPARAPPLLSGSSAPGEAARESHGGRRGAGLTLIATPGTPCRGSGGQRGKCGRCEACRSWREAASAHVPGWATPQAARSRCTRRRWAANTREGVRMAEQGSMGEPLVMKVNGFVRIAYYWIATRSEIRGDRMLSYGSGHSAEGRGGTWTARFGHVESPPDRSR